MDKTKFDMDKKIVEVIRFKVGDMVRPDYSMCPKGIFEDMVSIEDGEKPVSFFDRPYEITRIVKENNIIYIYLDDIKFGANIIFWTLDPSYVRKQKIKKCLK